MGKRPAARREVGCLLPAFLEDLNNQIPRPYDIVFVIERCDKSLPDNALGWWTEAKPAPGVD
jgi:hypothetical protein